MDAFVCQICGARRAERGSCPACAVPCVPEGMTGEAVDALADPPLPPVTGWHIILGLVLPMFGFVAVDRYGHVNLRGLFYTVVIAAAIAAVAIDRGSRGLRRRRARRAVREALDARSVTPIRDVERGIARVAGRVRMDDAAGPVAMDGEAPRGFTIDDASGAAFVSAGAVIAAWGDEHVTLSDGDLVELVGFARRAGSSEGPRGGYRGVGHSIELCGRDGVPLYVRRLEAAPPRVRVEVEAVEEVEAPAPREESARRR